MAEDSTPERPSKRARLEASEEHGKESQETLPAISSTIIEDDYQRELRVGITAFVGAEVPGFSGIFKQRYSDFLVNEILTTGEVLRLEDVIGEDSRKVMEVEKKGVEDGDVVMTDVKAENEKVLQEEESAKNGEGTGRSEVEIKKVSDEQQAAIGFGSVSKEESNGQEAAEADTSTSISEEHRAAVVKFFGEKTTKAVLGLYNAVLRYPERKRGAFDKIISDPIDDKDDRTAVHQLIRKVFDSKLETSTGENNSITLMPAMSSTRKRNREKWQNERTAGGARSHGKLGWEELGGEYLHFTLYKENKDTMEVISYLAGISRLHTKHFQFAGTKDRRGITVQRVSVLRMQSDRLAGLAKSLRNAKIGGLKYEKYGLSLGQLQGNEFGITLRDCHLPGEENLSLDQRVELARKVVGAAADSMRAKGFINYYGLQRFGSFAVSTHEIGIKLLQGDLNAAIGLILAYSPDVLSAAKDNEASAHPSDDRKRAVALETWEITKDVKQTLDLLPRKFSAEGSIVKHLGYRKGGKRVQENDWQGALMQIQRNLRLMYVHAYQSLVWNMAAGHRYEKYGDKVVAGDLVIDTASAKESKQEVDENGEVIINPAGEDRAVGEQDFVRARPVTEAEAQSGKYTILDIVLPLPGYDVVYPSNELGKFYEDFMASEAGGGLDPHDMRRKWRDISLSGGYRKFLARPAKLEWEVKTYTHDTEQLLKTDLDRLNGTKGLGQDNETTVDINHSGEPAKVAVVLQMQLGSSQYATMALRELLKAGGLKTYKAEFGKIDK